MPLFNSNKFLDLAEKLRVDTGYNDESRHRTAMGRAYYAAFLTVRTKLEILGQVFQGTAKDHGDVIRAVGGGNTPIGNRLHTLRTGRNNADYDLDQNIKAVQSDRSVAIAKAVVQLTTKLNKL